MMSADDKLKAKWAKITDPVEALKELSKNQEFVGSDPYYRDLNDSLWEMVERVLALQDAIKTLETVG